jgi:hypothetical protein
VTTLSALLLGLFGLSRRPNAYRPEKHYMRGPGPKCREKLGYAAIGAR